MDEEQPIQSIQPEVPVSKTCCLSSPWKIVSFTLVGILALVIAVFAGIQIGREQENQKVVPPTIPTNTPTPTIDSTTDWKTYNLETIGLEFKLPPALNRSGEMREEIIPGEKGTELCMTFTEKPTASGDFCNIKHFGFGAISTDYEAGRGGGFNDLSSGFVVENGKYYVKQRVSPKFEISADLASEVKSQYGVQIIKIIGKNSTSGEWRGAIPGTPGDGNIGALFNTTNKIYPGIAVVMELSGSLTEELFDQILSTFKFLDGASPTCGSCPQLMPPSPDFCKDGTIVSGGIDKCGCQMPPRCEIEP